MSTQMLFVIAIVGLLGLLWFGAERKWGTGLVFLAVSFFATAALAFRFLP